MRKLSFTALMAGSFVFAVLAGGPADVKAQSRQITVHGFVQQDDYFPQSKLPMTSDEKRLRSALAPYLDKLNRDAERSDGYWLPKKVGGRALLNVKISQESVLLDFKSSVLRENGPGSFEDFVSFVSDMTNVYLNRLFKQGPVEVIIVFDGYRITRYYPLPKKRSNLDVSPRLADTVVVSAGHGLTRFFNATGTFTRWNYQRPLSPVDATYREDLATPDYADVLAANLHAKSEAIVRFPRNPSRAVTTYSIPPIPPVGTLWRNMGARYHLETILPGRPDIWNTTSATDPVQRREYGQDRRSRPLYSNAIGAKGLISLHTNAIGNSSVRGGLVIYDTNVIDSQKLAGFVAFCLQNAGRTIDPTYTARAVNRTGAYGELSLSAAASVLVEIAYHTNAVDVALLKNLAFRTATMAGVEQGWRNYRTVQRPNFCPP